MITYQDILKQIVQNEHFIFFPFSNVTELICTGTQNISKKFATLYLLPDKLYLSTINVDIHNPMKKK